MPLFKPKQVPILTVGRLKHFIFGVAVVLVAGHWGTLGVLFGVAAVAAFGLGWELLTATINRAFSLGWKHPYGDLIDFLSYLAGAALVFIPWLLFWRTTL